jgi:uncharacterized glyoxalase superfamily protein PhnB
MPSIYPIIGYKDAPAVIEWLCRVFGFTRHTVIDGDNGLIAHAELTLGSDAIVMLGSIQNDTFGLRVPREIGAMTGGIYAAVEDTTAHYEHARAAGAEIVQEPGTQQPRTCPGTPRSGPTSTTT